MIWRSPDHALVVGPGAVMVCKQLEAEEFGKAIIGRDNKQALFVRANGYTKQDIEAAAELARSGSAA